MFPLHYKKISLLKYKNTTINNQLLKNLLNDKSAVVRRQMFSYEDMLVYFHNISTNIIIAMNKKPIGYISYLENVFEMQIIKSMHNKMIGPLVTTLFLEEFFMKKNNSLIITYIHESNKRSYSSAIKYGWVYECRSEKWRKLILHKEIYEESKFVIDIKKRYNLYRNVL